MFDIVGSVLLLPVLAFFSVALLVLNPFFNRGRLWFVQERMGRNCEPFPTLKFRTMTEAEHTARSANCPLEVDRITRLGRFLRKTRIDELPQIVNVLRGEMSLIGPRPDYYEHAQAYLHTVPGYRSRHAVRPGISGLAQTEVGYVEGHDETKLKVEKDLYYIANSTVRLEAWIFYRTLAVVLGQRGA
ncbi:MAG: sugar transferase [Pseudomonadota bacterium]